MACMDQLEPIEKAGVDELRALQLERLGWSLDHAYQNVPHYRQAFDALQVHPRDLKQLADLKQFPFTTKNDLRLHYPFGMFATTMQEIVRVHASSGTTGQPTVVGYTREDIAMWAGVMARSLRASGVRSSDLVQIAYGYGLFTGGLGAHYGAEALGATVIPAGGGMTERQVKLICDFKPGVIMSTPSYLLVIADEFERQGIDPAKSSPRIGIFGAEPWSASLQAELERRFGIKALDLYGLSEVIGPGVAAECLETHDGLTIWEDHFYPEIIDPQTGAVLPEGETGELVLTSLTKVGMPVIRYRTRDRTHLLPGTARPMRRMARVSGRTDDMLIIRGVNVFPSQIEEIIVQQASLSAHYQLEVRRDSHMDQLDVLVERRADLATPLQEAERRALGQAVERQIKGLIGVSTRVEVMEPQTLQRSQGKAVRVIDKRSKVE